ncbi:sigma-54-dependent transcriptional regulator [Planctomicrobium piriforme]|uniref:DNA-binding transcriptional response regulator, NtrC family, contains REC, AAA-type ATPase, and a Fis-type DNA-binding domains n=1 Tax=Planctomicrobium piriforme TaxID=1576369 RepID=A0A1I3TE01_9PLAN|nr:sigma-54 dependent transcriptional regulator [Planctomicrobium piriforme]SFJ68732.1 DNA-binding transcriptional response regulator, NtrC family, contains REC, AAA-type ATPase, and a Fis-type DNA-binding domains [Planctomicrobium piriforme]
MSNQASLLVVDDDRHICEAMADYLRSLGHRTETATTCREAIERIKDFNFHVVVCDVNLPDQDGFQLLEWAVVNAPTTAVILLTGYGTIESAVEAIRLGAFDYLTKPVIDDELNFSIQRALGQRKIVEENKSLRKQLDDKFGLSNIIGRDYKMAKMFDLLESVADTRTTVLILGENGTGKTITARAIHQLSTRRDKPFVEVACGALPDTLLESELFGHVKGSFTGATQDKPGKFLQANGGTIFLDEIGTASQSLQVKLLRVLQDREFEPVGGNTTHKVDIRLILATNEDLEARVRSGEFRQDLFYRINVISVTQPPLRERLGDIPLLVAHYLEEFNSQTGKKVREFDDHAMHALQRYNWPGNVRELVNVVERAIVLSKSDVVGIGDLPEHLRRDEHDTAYAVTRLLGRAGLKSALADPERQIIIDALEQQGWNRQETARVLGINRTTLYKKMKKYDISYEKQVQMY